MSRALRIVGLSILCILLVPSQAHALLIYCGGLPGCGSVNGAINFLPGMLAKLLALLEIYARAFGYLFIVIGGVYLVIGGFSEEYVTKGKTTIIWAMIGLFLSKSASLLVGLITAEVGSIPGNDIVVGTIGLIIEDVAILLNTVLFGIAVYCGMRMVVSRGQEEEFKKARNGLFYAAIGAIVINMSQDLVDAVLAL